MRALRIALRGQRLHIVEDGVASEAVPSMQHPAFQRILKEGWVSPPSFGPSGDLRMYSAARGTKPKGYDWFASADWRRGRIQLDREGAITDIPIEPYGRGAGSRKGEPLEIVIGYDSGALSITVGESSSALGRWSYTGLELQADEGAAHAVDGALAAAIFLWCAKPEAFQVHAKPPF